MRLALRTSLLTAALLHPLLAAPPALAQPSSTEAGEPAPAAAGPDTLVMLLSGMAGASLLIPSAYAGYSLGNLLLPPPRSCTPSGCIVGFPLAGIIGTVTGGVLGGPVAAGMGVSIAGMLQGGRFHWFPAVLGSVIGSAIGGAAGGVAGFFFPFFAQLTLAALVTVGAVAGAYIGYSTSNPWPGPQAFPLVAVVPGGGVLGIAGCL